MRLKTVTMVNITAHFFKRGYLQWSKSLRGVIVGYVTQTARRNDQEIQSDVSEELRSTPGIGPIGVTVSGGAVTLSGEVGSLPERWAAKQAAMRVSGVKAVADELQVRAS